MTVSIDLPVIIVYGYLFLVGAVIGSFLNVCILRMAEKPTLREQLKSLVDQPSHCFRCGTAIRWFDNVPIFGWLNLRGRCRNCHRRISPRYPLIEFANACLWVLVFWMEVPLGWAIPLENSSPVVDIGPQAIPGLGMWSPEAFVFIRFLLHMVLIEALLVATMIDFDKFIIPDGSTLPAMAVGLLGGLLFARLHLVPVWFQSTSTQMSLALLLPDWMHDFLGGPDVPLWIKEFPHLHGLVASVVGLLVGGGIVWLVRLIGFWTLKQEAMGFGDVVLMAMVGAFLGWQPTLIAFFLAPLFAIVAVLPRLFTRRGRYIPYGPYLSLATLVTVLFWQPIFASTRHLFELGILLLPIALTFAVMFAAALVLLRAVKLALGFSVGEPEPAGTWTSGDQTWFFKGEHVDRHSMNWRSRDWNGQPAAHGTIHEERWRRHGQTGHRWEK